MLNQVKAHQSSGNYFHEPAVVVGASMGGIVARYALSFMEKNNIKHCVQNYISFDAPQQGANLPLSLQYWIEFFASNGPDGGSTDAQAKLAGKINRPAARQLLTMHYDDPDKSYLQQDRANFTIGLNYLGYPQKLRKVAIASGSRFGINQDYMLGGDMLLKTDWSPLLCMNTRFIMADCYAMPTSLIFAGKIPKNKAAALGCLALAPVGCALCASLNIGYDTKSIYGPGNQISYDNAPGGFRNTAWLIAENYNNSGASGNADPNPLGRAENPNECFIPTISSLDVNTTNLNFNVDNNINKDGFNSQYPFDAYYASQTNRQHVTIEAMGGGIDNSNADWVLNELLRSESICPEMLDGSSLNGGVYNLGRKENAFLRNLTIGNGGKYYVNANMLTDFGTSTNPAPAGGISNPTPGSTLNAATCDCDNVIINIQAGGELILGDASAGNKAIVTFRSGSRINIETGGRLLINNNSNLIFEEGAILSYAPGAIIELSGNNAVLEIKGTIHLEDNAIFNLPYQQNGQRGHLLFSPTNSGITNITCGTNASIELTGKSKNDVMVVLDQGILNIPENLELFKISRAGVNFKSSNGRISIGAKKYLLEYSKFFNAGTGTSGLGLIGYGQDNSLVNGCIFSKLTSGFYGVLFYGGHPLKITTSNFDNCGAGVFTEGVGVELSNNTFYQCGSGWSGNGLTLNNYIEGCRFKNNDIGINAWGDNNVLLSINKSTFYQNNNYGVYASDGLIIRSKCSGYVQNGEYGIYAGNNSTVNLSRNFNAGYNTFSDNGSLAINLNYSKEINLENGMNSFTAIQPGTCISQGINCNTIIGGNIIGWNCPIPISINLTGNTWGPISPTIQNLQKLVNVNWYRLQCSAKIPIISKEPKPGGSGNTQSYYCLTKVEEALKKEKRMIAQIEPCPECPIIMTPDFEGVRLDHAANIALKKIETAGEEDHHKALDLFHQILFFPIENPGEQEKRILEISYQKMRESLAEEIIMKHPDSPEDIEKMMQIINKYHDQAVIEGENMTIAHFKKDRSYLEKLKEAWSQAIIPLAEIENLNIPELSGSNSKALCFTSIEKDVKTDILAKEKFMQAIQICTPNSTLAPPQLMPFLINPQGDTLTDPEAVFNVYPNPAMGNIEIYHGQQEKYIFELFDLSGKKLIVKSISSPTSRVDLGLKDGIYYYTIRNAQNDILTNKKLIIINP